MKVVILYHPESEFARQVEEYAHDFKQIKGKDVDLVSLETTAGSELARVYDIMAYPALLVIKDDNQLVKDWQTMPFPLKDEVAGYLSS